ncbi:MAG: GtrA family protein [Bacilli bacterium]|nr:GtrA family protein [Bacilli bacterium]
MEKYKKLFSQLIKFGIVGVLATILEWGIFYVLTNILNIHYILSTAIAFLTSTIFNYLLSVKYVFDVNKEKSKSNFIFFVVFSIIGLGLNELILWISIEKLNLYNMIGKIIATGIVMIFNFITRKLFLENRK